ncbi:uncharacterized protein LOC143195305 [Rhynchophorus ferrugineus]|uniref:uncharacterized protein LOC143195305 n=1 Tax=Rhynchophorus ferrugineus TaxID=354439 RepID=UPI003FCEBBF0
MSRAHFLPRFVYCACGLVIYCCLKGHVPEEKLWIYRYFSCIPTMLPPFEINSFVFCLLSQNEKQETSMKIENKLGLKLSRGTRAHLGPTQDVIAEKTGHCLFHINTVRKER